MNDNTHGRKYKKRLSDDCVSFSRPRHTYQVVIIFGNITMTLLAGRIAWPPGSLKRADNLVCPSCRPVRLT